MKKITVYESFDGERFNSEQGCLNHEQSTMQWKVSNGDKLLFFDENFKQLNPLEFKLIRNLMNAAYYIVVNDELIAKEFSDDIYEYTGYRFNNKGHYAYYLEDWVSINGVLEDMNSIIGKIDDVIKSNNKSKKEGE